MQEIPIEIVIEIFNLLDLKSQLKMNSLCKMFQQKMFITNLFNIENKYLNLLSDNIISQTKYHKIEKLNASYNSSIHDVSHMKNLKILYAEGNSGIDQKGIQNLDLVELSALYNPKIKDVSHMNNLKILYAYGNSGIDQKGIQKLDLIELNASNNPSIKDVSHMKNLKILYAEGNSGIDQRGIQNLDLIELYTLFNHSIKDISHMKNLKIHNYNRIK